MMEASGASLTSSVLKIMVKQITLLLVNLKARVMIENSLILTFSKKLENN